MSVAGQLGFRLSKLNHSWVIAIVVWDDKQLLGHWAGECRHFTVLAWMHWLQRHNASGKQMNFSHIVSKRAGCGNASLWCPQSSVRFARMCVCWPRGWMEVARCYTPLRIPVHTHTPACHRLPGFHRSAANTPLAQCGILKKKHNLSASQCPFHCS